MEPLDAGAACVLNNRSTCSCAFALGSLLRLGDVRQDDTKDWLRLV